ICRPTLERRRRQLGRPPANSARTSAATEFLGFELRIDEVRQTQPQRFRKYHSPHNSPTTNRKYGGESQGVNLVSVSTSRSRGSSLIFFNRSGNCSGATTSPPLALVSLAKLAISSGRAAAFSISRSCSYTVNRALASPKKSSPAVAET